MTALFARDLSSPSPYYTFNPNAPAPTVGDFASFLSPSAAPQMVPMSSALTNGSYALGGATSSFGNGLTMPSSTPAINSLASLRSHGLSGGSPVKFDASGDRGTGVNSTGMASMFDWSKLGLGAAVSMANLYNGWQAGKLAKQQFEYSKGLSDTNLYNSATNYNAALESQAKSAGIMNGTSDADVAARIAKYSAKTKI